MSKNRLLQIINKLGLTNKDKSDLVNIIEKGNKEFENEINLSLIKDINDESKRLIYGSDNKYDLEFLGNFVKSETFQLVKENIQPTIKCDQYGQPIDEYLGIYLFIINKDTNCKATIYLESNNSPIQYNYNTINVEFYYSDGLLSIEKQFTESLDLYLIKSLIGIDSRLINTKISEIFLNTENDKYQGILDTIIKLNNNNNIYKILRGDLIFYHNKDSNMGKEYINSNGDKIFLSYDETFHINLNYSMFTDDNVFVTYLNGHNISDGKKNGICYVYSDDYGMIMGNNDVSNNLITCINGNKLISYKYEGNNFFITKTQEIDIVELYNKVNSL